jgi:hypothetical protein
VTDAQLYALTLSFSVSTRRRKRAGSGWVGKEEKH